MQSITPDPAGTTAPVASTTAPPAMPRRRMPLLRNGRPRKRWRYVGIFGEELMACAALVQVGAARQSFWAVYLRDTDELRERTRLLPRRRALSLEEGGRLRIRDRGVALDVRLAEDDGFSA